MNAALSTVSLEHAHRDLRHIHVKRNWSSPAVRDESGTAVGRIDLPSYFVVVVKTVYKRDGLRIWHVDVFERAIRVHEWPRIKTENETANDRAEVVDIGRKRCASRLRVLDHRERPVF